MIIQNSHYTLKFPARQTHIIVANIQERKQIVKFLNLGNIPLKELSENEITIQLTAPRLMAGLNLMTEIQENLFDMLKADLKMPAIVHSF